MNYLFNKFTCVKIIVVVLCLDSGCAVTPRPDVINVYSQPIYNTHTDPDTDFKRLDYFSFVSVAELPDSKMNSITEKKIQFMVRNKLEELGYEYVKDASKSDFTVVITYSNQSETKYIPPKTVNFPIYHPSETKTGSFSYSDYGSLSSGSGTYSYEQPGYTSYVPITTGGYSVVYYYPTLLVTAYASKDLNKRLWTGSVVSSSSEHDVRKAAQCYINLYLFNWAKPLFPRKYDSPIDDSGDGGFGIYCAILTPDGNEFYPYVIVVYTQSDLWQQGLRPGDWILAIDGKSVRNMTIGNCTKLLDKNKGEKITFSINRNGNIIDITAKAIDEQIAVKEWTEIQYMDTSGRRKFHKLKQQNQ